MKKFITYSILFILSIEIISASDLIRVTNPAYCSNIQGKTKISVSAPGFSQLAVYCWKQGKNFGSNSLVATFSLNSQGVGSFIFPADKYPHGPITIKISGTKNSLTDNCYLQLYNNGGISWKEGIPSDPPAAKGMKLIFADDFDKGLSIGDNTNKTYYDHKPPFGLQDFSSIPFVGFDKYNNPFKQMDTYLRIRVSEKDKSTGLISSLKNDKTGITAKAPCYFECRFIAPNASGTWPAFWLLSVLDTITSTTEPCDELDIIEAYGGEDKGSPNAKDHYMVTPHAWSQDSIKTECDLFFRTKSLVSMKKVGIPSTWYESPHIFGCKITEIETIYYCDNIELCRHKTLPISKVKPFYFLINLATGGGWPVDLSRNDGIADMYVDYVRVYSGVESNSDK